MKCPRMLGKLSGVTKLDRDIKQIIHQIFLGQCGAVQGTRNDSVEGRRDRCHINAVSATGRTLEGRGDSRYDGTLAHPLSAMSRWRPSLKISTALLQVGPAMVRFRELQATDRGNTPPSHDFHTSSVFFSPFYIDCQTSAALLPLKTTRYETTKLPHLSIIICHTFVTLPNWLTKLPVRLHPCMLTPHGDMDDLWTLTWHRLILTLQVAYQHCPSTVWKQIEVGGQVCVSQALHGPMKQRYVANVGESRATTESTGGLGGNEDVIVPDAREPSICCNFEMHGIVRG